MNQIQFREKRRDNNEWMYGYVIQEPSGRMFIGTYLLGGVWDWLDAKEERLEKIFI